MRRVWVRVRVMARVRVRFDLGGKTHERAG